MKLHFINSRQQKRNSRSYYHDQRGIYIPVFALLFVAFVSVLGLAVDIGQLYRAKLRIQRAVDAGVVGGSRFISTQNSAQAVAVAQNIARSNLITMDPRLANVTLSATLNGNVLSMSGNLELPLMILDAIPGFRKVNEVEAVARAANQRAVVVLVLDLSGSMEPYCVNGALVEDRIGDLRTAVENFINLFDNNWDYIGVVGFNRRGMVIRDLSSPLDSRSLKADITQIGRGSTLCDGTIDTPASGYSIYNLVDATNIQHGLARARFMLDDLKRTNLGLYENAHRAVVLVTDGAPTASCGSLSITGDCQSLIPVLPTTFSRDVRHYERALLESDLIRADLEVPVHTIGLGTLLDAGQPDEIFGYKPLELRDAYQDFTNTWSLKSNFLRRIALVDSIPDKYLGLINSIPDTVIADGLKTWNFTSPRTYYFRQQSSDFIRTRNLGPGERYSNPPTSTTTYSNTTPAMDNGSTIPRVHEFMTAYPTAPIGTYRSTPNSTQLMRLLSEIGTSIRSRLIG